MTQGTGPRLFRMNIEVGDLAEANEFYSRLLGVEGRIQMGSRCYFGAGAVTLQVVEATPPHLAAKALYFSVENLEQVYRRATELNCLAQGTVHGSPAGEAVVRPWGERSFYAEDPWGNPLCFVDAETIYAG